LIFGSDKIYFSLKRPDYGNGAHAISYSIGTGGFQPGGKISEARGTVHILPFGIEVKNKWSNTYTFPYTFMACTKTV
jgi:hypothetical protein